MRLFLLVSILAFLAYSCVCADTASQNSLGIYDVKSLGAKGDGVTDDTKAIQDAMDTASKSGGGVVFLPTGKYLVDGSLKVPYGVTLQGVAESPQYVSALTGSVVLATRGKGSEDGPALFEMGDSCAVRGLTVFYPEQTAENIAPYPWTFHLYGGDATVECVTLINSYNGIKVGPTANVRHQIRNVYGCVLRRGIYVDYCSDIGRIENIQFHCHWWNSPALNGHWDKVYEYMWKNLEAFTFGRTDWEYVTNTFVFPAKIGYRFIETEHGAMNGQLCGIGADATQNCIVVDQVQPFGLLITNGQFVSMNGDHPIQVIINEKCKGTLRFVNCSFWGHAEQCVVSRGQWFLSFNDCQFRIDADDEGKPVMEVSGGRLQVRGCTFDTRRPSVYLKEGVKNAIISENNGAYGLRVINEIGDKAIIVNNEPNTREGNLGQVLIE